jgi:hypothetical protein
MKIKMLQGRVSACARRSTHARFLRAQLDALAHNLRGG